MVTDQDSLESRMQGKLARPVWGWGPGAIPGPTPLFVGSVSAGYRAADLMTLVSSAVRNDLDVWSYVKGVLDALLTGCEDYASLRPDAWAAAHPEHLRQYRIEERQERAERKRQSREKRRCLQASGSR